MGSSNGDPVQELHYGAMHLTQVVQFVVAGSWENIRAQCWSSAIGLRTMRRAATISPSCVGRKGSAARYAASRIIGSPRGAYRRKIARSSAEVGENLLPLANRVASLLKRWLLGTHQGAVSATHLDYYLDEYTFRFNRRTSGSRGLLFLRLMQQAVDLSPVPAKEILGGSPTSRKPNQLMELESTA